MRKLKLKLNPKKGSFKGPKQKLDTKKPTLSTAQVQKAKEALKGVGSSYANEIKPFQPKQKLDTKKTTLRKAQLKEAVQEATQSYVNEKKPFQPKKK